MEWLKADLHMHSKEDHFDVLSYSAYELMDRCAELHFRVIAITNHIIFTYKESWREYAAEKGMLLIPGVEASIQGKHVLILNADVDANRLRSFEDLAAYLRSNDVYVIAPHPFSWSPICLREYAYKYADLFDAVEIHHFYTKHLNPNKRAYRFAEEYDKCLIANSDCHHPRYLGKTYSLIHTEFTISSVLDALRRGDIKIVTEPLGSVEAFNLHTYLRIGQFKRAVRLLRRSDGCKSIMGLITGRSAPLKKPKNT